jgi:hypothetical protein
MLHDFAKTGDIDGFINAVIHNNNTQTINYTDPSICGGDPPLLVAAASGNASYSTDQE